MLQLPWQCLLTGNGFFPGRVENVGTYIGQGESAQVPAQVRGGESDLGLRVRSA